MHERDHQQHLAHALAEQQVHVLRVDERQRDAEHRRQRQQHVAGEAAVRRVDPHLAQNLEALADDVREVLEDLRQVAAGLALDQDRGREEPHVEQRHAHGQVLERVLHRQAEVLLVERLAELGADRLGHLVGDHLQAGRERVAGLERAGDQIQRLRELFLERAQPAGALDVQYDERQREAERRRRATIANGVRDQHRQRGTPTTPGRATSDTRSTRADARLHARLLDPAAERGPARRAADDAIERRQRALVRDLHDAVALVVLGHVVRRCEISCRRCIQLALQHHARHLRERRSRRRGRCATPSTNARTTRMNSTITAPPSRLRTCRAAGGCPTP